jgi:hypothetical protein
MEIYLSPADSSRFFRAQDYARVIAKRAAGDDVFERYRRVQIVNLWRPLQGKQNCSL